MHEKSLSVSPEKSNTTIYPIQGTARLSPVSAPSRLPPMVIPIPAHDARSPHQAEQETYRRRVYGEDSGDSPRPQDEHRNQQGHARREGCQAEVSPENGVFLGFPVTSQQVA